MTTSPTCIDLFAGCGGLSLGLKQAGFKVKFAVEKSPMAAETYYHNLIRAIDDPEKWKQSHRGLSVEAQAKAGLVVKELAEVLDSKGIFEWLAGSEIDLVAGGPPCQGFSLAGRRNPDDARNQLPEQFLKFVEKVQPKAVIIENVSGIQHDFRKHGKRSPFGDLQIALSKTGPGYVVQPMLLNAKHFGAPQHRPRVFLVGVRSDLVDEQAVNITADTWDSALDSLNVKVLGKRPFLAPKRTHYDEPGSPRHLTVEDAIGDLSDVGYDKAASPSHFALEMRTDTEFLHSKASEKANPVGPANHVLRKHSERVKERFRLYQYLRKTGIHPSVLALAKDASLSANSRRERMFKAISHVKYPVTSNDGTTLARNRDEFTALLENLATKKHSQRALSRDNPAPTVVSLPDDFVHPERPRVPTVRELARFQTFPDAFEFRSKETTGGGKRRSEVPQYTQVGNAVPPRLARALGERLREVLTAGSLGSATKKETTAVA